MAKRRSFLKNLVGLLIAPAAAPAVSKLAGPKYATEILCRPHLKPVPPRVDRLGQTVTIGGITYTFLALHEAGANEIRIGANLEESVANFNAVMEGKCHMVRAVVG